MNAFFFAFLRFEIKVLILIIMDDIITFCENRLEQIRNSKPDIPWFKIDRDILPYELLHEYGTLATKDDKTTYVAIYMSSIKPYKDMYDEYALENKKAHFIYVTNDVEDVENYELAKNDNFKGWVLHHRLETESITNITSEELKALDLYYHRPASELKFLTAKEHSRIHAISRLWRI